MTNKLKILKDLKKGTHTVNHRGTQICAECLEKILRDYLRAINGEISYDAKLHSAINCTEDFIKHFLGDEE